MSDSTVSHVSGMRRSALMITPRSRSLNPAPRRRSPSSLAYFLRLMRDLGALLQELRPGLSAGGFGIQVGAGHYRDGRRRGSGGAGQEDRLTVGRACGHAEDETENRDGPIFHTEHDVANGIGKRRFDRLNDRARQPHPSSGVEAGLGTRSGDAAGALSSEEGTRPHRGPRRG